jgi:hypothetical protein
VAQRGSGLRASRGRAKKINRQDLQDLHDLDRKPSQSDIESC